jgi:phage terminase Nu1 subunit (DNA packaging protein)
MDINTDSIHKMIFAIEEQPIVNRRELAEVLNVNETTVLNWRKQGMPAEMAGDKGVENRYHLSACVAWLLSREFERITKVTAKDRLDQARAQLAEVQLARELKILVPKDLYEEATAKDILACRNELLNLPVKLVQKLNALYGVEIDEEVILEDVEEALRNLAEGTPDDGLGDLDDADSETEIMDEISPGDDY